MQDTARESRHPGERHLRLRPGTRGLGRPRQPRGNQPQGHDARGTLRQSHAAHRRMPRGHDKLRGTAEPRHRSPHRREGPGTEESVPRRHNRQHKRLQRRGIRLLLRPGGRVRRDRHRGGEHLLPQRAQRRHGVRHRPFGRSTGDRRREEGLPRQARVHKAQPQRDRYRVDCQGMRGCRSGRADARQHLPRHAHRHTPQTARHRREDRRLLRKGDIPDSPQNGLSGAQGLPHTDNGLRRRRLRRRRP